MANIAHFLSVFVPWIALPCLAIIGILYHRKHKTKESLIFVSGIALTAVGALIQAFSPFKKLTIDVAGKMFSSSGPPLGWYTGSILFSVGLIITVVGFALMTWKK